jgi:hypothetical protein
MKLKSLLVLAFPVAVVAGAAYAQSYFNAPPLIGLISASGSSPYSSLATTGTAGPSYDNAQAMLLLGLGADGKYHVCGTANPCTGGGGGGGGGATIPSTTNLISGDGAGNGADSGIVPGNVGLLSGTQTFTGAKTFNNAKIATTAVTGFTTPSFLITDSEVAQSGMVGQSILAPNQAVTNTLYTIFGHDGTVTRNSGYLGFNYQGTGSTANAVFLGLTGVGPNMTLFGDGDVGVGSADNGFKMEVAGSFRATTVSTTTNCSSTAAPAVCAAAAGGSVVVAAAATTVVVNTTAVTANSQILLTSDVSLGTKLGVTCNVAPAQEWVSARTAGTSFTITVAAAPTTNPQCLSYMITN